MRAILFAANEPTSMRLMSARYPLALFHILDRPVLQVIIEYLIEQDVTAFEIVLHHLAESVESYFGDGQRWGIPIRYHLCKDPEQPYQVLRTLDLSGDDSPVLLGHILSLPEFPALILHNTDRATSTHFVCAALPDATPACSWTGWALCPPQAWTQVPPQADYALLASALSSAPHTDVVCDRLLRFDSYTALMQANSAVVAGQFPQVQPPVRQNEPGVWIGRNVMLHPTASVTPPIYIGEHCRIGAHVHLGPNAVIGTNSILDTGCTVEESVVMRDSYIGEGLDLHGVIVNKNLLVNTRLDVESHMTEHFMLGGLTGQPLQKGVARFVASFVGLLLGLITLPILLLVSFVLLLGRRGPLLFRKSYLTIPVDSDARWHEMSIWSFTVAPEKLSGLRYILLFGLPALWSIAQGKLRLVGLPPRSAEEVWQLPDDWRALYLQGHAGLITEVGVRYGADVSDTAAYTADAYYVVCSDFWYDIKLCLVAFCSLFHIHKVKDSS